MINAIPLEATTRSKIGQSPLLYIRIEYNTTEFFLGDLRRYVEITHRDGKEMPFDETAKLRSTNDYILDLIKLCQNLKESSNKIHRIHFWKHKDLKIKGMDIEKGNIANTEISVVSLLKLENGTKVQG
jgi:CRISPR-associated protein Csh2